MIWWERLWPWLAGIALLVAIVCLVDIELNAYQRRKRERALDDYKFGALRERSKTRPTE